MILSPTSKLKLGVVGLAVSGISLFALSNWLFGEATVHLLVSLGRTVELSANGQVLSPTSRQGVHVQYSLKQGDYSFSVKDMMSGKARTYTLKLDSGFDSYVLPVDEGQCFTRLDVSKTWYGDKDKSQRPAPIVHDRISAEAPFSKKSADYLDTVELPHSVKKSASVMLLTDVECDALTLDDRALLSEVGF